MEAVEWALALLTTVGQVALWTLVALLFLAAACQCAFPRRQAAAHGRWQGPLY